MAKGAFIYLRVEYILFFFTKRYYCSRQELYTHNYTFLWIKANHFSPSRLLLAVNKTLGAIAFLLCTACLLMFPILVNSNYFPSAPVQSLHQLLRVLNLVESRELWLFAIAFLALKCTGGVATGQQPTELDVSSEAKCKTRGLERIVVLRGGGIVSNTDDNTFKSSDRKYQSVIAKHLSLIVDCSTFKL